MIYDDPEFDCGYKSICPDGPYDICQNCIYHPDNWSDDYDEDGDDNDIEIVSIDEETEE